MSEPEKDLAAEVEALLSLVDEFLEHMAALEAENQALREQLGKPGAGLSEEPEARHIPVLVLDADAARGRSLADALSGCGCAPEVAVTVEEALGLLDQHDFVLAFVQGDIEGAADGSGGMDFIRQAREKRAELEIIVLVSFTSADQAVQALRLGASDFLIHPVQREDLESRVRAVIGRRQIELRSRRYMSDFRQRYESLRARLRG